MHTSIIFPAIPLPLPSTFFRGKDALPLMKFMYMRIVLFCNFPFHYLNRFAFKLMITEKIYVSETLTQIRILLFFSLRLQSFLGTPSSSTIYYYFDFSKEGVILLLLSLRCKSGTPPLTRRSKVAFWGRKANNRSTILKLLRCAYETFHLYI
jgi:hypothetical protein